MSFKHTELVMNYSKARGPDKVIMLVFGIRSNDEGECWPGLNCIAKDTGLARSTVAARLPKIQQMGEILIQRRGHKQRDGRSNLYKITLAPPDSHSPGGGLTGKTDSPSHRPQIVREADGSSSGRRTSHSPGGGLESSLNPHLNRQRTVRGQAAGLPDHGIDSEKAELPEVKDYADIHNFDPILIAMAITGERSKQGWGHWVKVLNKARRELGTAKAERLFRSCLEELYGELKAGECIKPGACLNEKLKVVFS